MFGRDKDKDKDKSSPMSPTSPAVSRHKDSPSSHNKPRTFDDSFAPIPLADLEVRHSMA